MLRRTKHNFSASSSGAAAAATILPRPKDSTLYLAKGLGDSNQNLMPPVTGRCAFSFSLSDRGVCCCCGFNLKKGSPRIGIYLQSVGDIHFPIFSHVGCFVHSMPRIYSKAAFGDISRYAGLGLAPRQVVDSILQGVITGYANASVEEILGQSLSEQVEEQRARQLAVKSFYEAKNSKQLFSLLKDNYTGRVVDSHPVFSLDNISNSKQRLVDVVVDSATFGCPALDDCQTCQDRTAVLYTSRDTCNEMKCSGSIDSFTRCWVHKDIEEVPRTREWHDPELSSSESSPLWSSAPRQPVSLEKRLAQKVPEWMAERTQSESKINTLFVPRPFFDVDFCVLRPSQRVIAKLRAKPSASRLEAIEAAATELEEKIKKLGGRVHAEQQQQQQQPVTTPALPPGTVCVRPSAIIHDEALFAPPSYDGAVHVFPAYVDHTLAAGRRVTLVECAVVDGMSMHFSGVGAPDPKKFIQAHEQHKARLENAEKEKQQQQQLQSAASSSSVASTTSPYTSKGSALVDPASGLADTHEVYTETLDENNKPVHVPFSCSLVKSDIITGKNSFYSMGIFVKSGADVKAAAVWRVTNSNGVYPAQPTATLWRRFGRVGDPMSVDEKRSEAPLSLAIDEFVMHFQRRTGQSWADVTAIDSKFVKQPGKYYWSDRPVSFRPPALSSPSTTAAASVVAVAVSDAEKTSPAVNNPATRALIKRMFDVDDVNRIMGVELRIDTSKMPLATLNKSTVDNGKEVLGKISSLLQQAASSSSSAALQRDLLVLTNQYNNIVPRVVPRGADPQSLIISTQEQLQEQNVVLDELDMMLDTKKLIELSSASSGSSGGDPVHRSYETLKCTFVPLDLNADPDAALFVKWFAVSQAKTHHCNRTIVNMWKIEREGERKQFDDFCAKQRVMIHQSAASAAAAAAAPAGKKKKQTSSSSSSSNSKKAALTADPTEIAKIFPPRQLLVHGSSFGNFCSILSTGLKLRPAGIILTGSMFNTGIYSSSCVSKATNYCRMNSSNFSGLCLLNTVYVGTPGIRFQADTSFTLKPGESSCWGRGRTTSDPAGTVALPSDSSVMVPAGKLIKARDSLMNTRGSSLLYDEIIVYAAKQLMQSYLVEIK